MKEISAYKTAKVTKKDLREYLSAFPQKGMAGKDASDVKVSKRDVNFLLNGKQDMEATELHNLLANTQIEEFDAIEEAFNLLDVDRQGYLTVDCFKTIFEKLKLNQFLIEKPINDTVYISLLIDNKGKISITDKNIPKSTINVIPNFESIITNIIDSIPDVLPATKTNLGVSVTSKFKLPIIIKSK